MVISALLLLFARGCSAGTVRTFSGTDNHSGNTVAAGSFCDRGEGVGDRSTVSRPTVIFSCPPFAPRSYWPRSTACAAQSFAVAPVAAWSRAKGEARAPFPPPGLALVEFFALPLHTARLSTLLVAGGALPVLSGRGARRRGPLSSPLLLLFSRGCSAATLCTWEGTEIWGNTVTAGSPCDGSYSGIRLCARRRLPPPPLAPSASAGPSAPRRRRDFRNRGLSGTVPTELALLPQLTYLYAPRPSPQGGCRRGGAVVARAGGEGQRTRSGHQPRPPRLAWPLAHPSASSTRNLVYNDLSGTVLL